jgi:hypothetical protein
LGYKLGYNTCLLTLLSLPVAMIAAMVPTDGRTAL